MLVKSTDMEFALKDDICRMLKSYLDRFGEELGLVCEAVTENLEVNKPGAWICLVGRKFVANICHEPGHFIRISNENYHFVVFKLKFLNESSIAEGPCLIRK